MAHHRVPWLFFAGIVAAAASCSGGKLAGSSAGHDGGNGENTPPATEIPDGAGSPGSVTGGGDAESQADDGGAPNASSPFMQVSCSGSATTSLRGTVYDPAGQVPLSHVAVYVPTNPLQPLPPGPSCGSCTSLYDQPLVSAFTDTAGNFTIGNMPVGQHIPLVVQMGKWRIQYFLSNVAPCVANDASALIGGTLRLPRNHKEGDMPNIAMSTGAGDSLECLFRRMGIDAAEYTGDPAGAGRIHIFTGGDIADGRGGAQTSAPVSKPSYQFLWNSNDSIMQYDLVVLSCEGAETSNLNDAGRQVLWDYLNEGGYVFASHFHYAWLTPTGPFAAANPPLATWSVGDQVVGDATSAYTADVATTLPSGQSFSDGILFKQWLQNVGALSGGGLSVYYARGNATLAPASSGSLPWLNLDPASPAPNATELFSVGMPYGIAASEQCGRIVYSDLHVSGGAGSQDAPGVPPDYPGVTAGGVVPEGCAAHALTPQEKALEYMVFDMLSCNGTMSIGLRPAPQK